MIFSENYKKCWESRIFASKGEKRKSLERIYKAQLDIEQVISETDLTYDESKTVLSNLELQINKMGTRYIGKTRLIQMSPND